MGFSDGPDSTDLLGYSMDGFKIYGPLNGTMEEVDAILDECNGIEVNGEYQYHVRTLDQVDGDSEYCFDNATYSPVINWKYVLGCYSGDISISDAYDAAQYVLDDDCFEEGSPTVSPTVNPTDRPSSFDERRPNIIVMQPDDMEFFDPWTPPPRNPSQPNNDVPFPNAGLEWMEKLREFDHTMSNIIYWQKMFYLTLLTLFYCTGTDGLQMLQAYTASPVCGTSRFSTITGKYF